MSANPDYIGSYAVYANFWGDYSARGGNNYKSGKFGNIMRPTVTVV